MNIFKAAKNMTNRITSLLIIQTLALSNLALPPAMAQTKGQANLSPTIQIENQLLTKTFLDLYQLSRENVGQPQVPGDVAFADLIAEGYNVVEHEEFDETLKTKRVRVEVFANNGKDDLNSWIKFLVVTECRTIIIDKFYPYFPEETRGRGRALLRYLLSRTEYAGYVVISNASEQFQKSFLKMSEYELITSIEHGEPVLNAFRKKGLNDLEHPEQAMNFMEKLELYEKLKEQWRTTSIYGVVPDTAGLDMVQDEHAPEAVINAGEGNYVRKAGDFSIVIDKREVLGENEELDKLNIKNLLKKAIDQGISKIVVYPELKLVCIGVIHHSWINPDFITAFGNLLNQPSVSFRYCFVNTPKGTKQAFSVAHEEGIFGEEKSPSVVRAIDILDKLKLPTDWPQELGAKRYRAEIVKRAIIKKTTQKFQDENGYRPNIKETAANLPENFRASVSWLGQWLSATAKRHGKTTQVYCEKLGIDYSRGRPKRIDRQARLAEIKTIITQLGGVASYTQVAQRLGMQTGSLCGWAYLNDVYLNSLRIDELPSYPKESDAETRYEQYDQAVEALDIDDVRKQYIQRLVATLNELAAKYKWDILSPVIAVGRQKEAEVPTDTLAETLWAIADEVGRGETELTLRQADKMDEKLIHKFQDQKKTSFESEEELKALHMQLAKLGYYVAKAEDHRWLGDQYLIINGYIFTRDDNELPGQTLAEGGAILYSQKDRFVIMSDAVDEKVKSGIRRALYGRMKIYEVPAGFVRLHTEGKPDKLMRHHHIDLTLGILEDAKILLVDPFYYRYPYHSIIRNIADKEGYEIVVVDESEAYLHPANFVKLPDGKILMENAPRTVVAIKRVLPKGSKLEIIPAKKSLRANSLNYGSLKCVSTHYYPIVNDLIEAGFSKEEIAAFIAFLESHKNGVAINGQRQVIMSPRAQQILATELLLRLVIKKEQFDIRPEAIRKIAASFMQLGDRKAAARINRLLPEDDGIRIEADESKINDETQEVLIEQAI